MASFPEGISRFSDKLVLAGCVLISLWLSSLDEPKRVEIGTRWAHRLLTPLEWSTHFVGGLADLKAENERLRGRIAAMQMDARQIDVERRHLEELYARAGFYERNRGTLMPATVLELVVSRIPVQAKIKSYGIDSLAVWQPVINERGLVGRIRQVLADDLALVELLTDEESRISIETVEGGVTGLLRYDGRAFFMDHVPQGDPVEAGSSLITSGLGGTVPRGIPVGNVAEVSGRPEELFQRVVVQPEVRFSALSSVYVITRPGPWYSRPGDSALAAGEVNAPAPTESIVPTEPEISTP